MRGNANRLDTYDKKDVHHRIFLRMLCFKDVLESEKRELYLSNYMNWLKNNLRSAFDIPQPKVQKKFLAYVSNPMYEKAKTDFGDTIINGQEHRI